MSCELRLVTACVTSGELGRRLLLGRMAYGLGFKTHPLVLFRYPLVSCVWSLDSWL